MQSNYYVVVIGDSITYGFPYLPDYSWVGLTSQELGMKMVNKGINGDTTGGMLERFFADVIAQRPTHVIIMGGANDAFERTAAQEVLDNIRRMTDTAIENSIIPFIGLPIPCNYIQEENLLGKYRELLYRISADYGIGIIDFFSPMVDESGRLREGLHTDGVHPNESGYRVMAAQAASFLRDKLAI